MKRVAERRIDPRLKLSYPIRLHPESGLGARPLGHTVTHNLSARGAYFCTARDRPYREGRDVTVVISVPHRLATGGKQDVTIDLRAAARIVRIDVPCQGINTEDGLQLTGVAVEFRGPLSFDYWWV